MPLAPEPRSTTTIWPRSGETMASSWPLEPRLPTWVTSSVSDRPQLSAATGHTWLSCLLKMSIVPSSLRFRTWISPAARANGVASGSGALGGAAERREHAVEQARPDHDGDDERPDERGIGEGAEPAASAAAAAGRLRLDRGGGPRPQVARRFGQVVPEGAEREPLLAVLGRDGAARAAPREMVGQPAGVVRGQRAVEALRREIAGALVIGGERLRPKPGTHDRLPHRRPGSASRLAAARSSARASASSSALRSAASAWRRLSRARVSSARAATCETPRAAASSRPVRSWSSASSSAERWRSGIRSSARCELAREARLHHEVLGGRRGVAGLADERDEPDDAPAAEIVERDAVGDLVQPGTRVLGLLERVVGAVGLHERVLREVRGEIGVAEHAQEVRVDLVLVLGEQLLDEGVRVVAVPAGAHGEAHGQGSALVQLEGFGSHGCSPGIDRAGRPIGSVRLRPRVTVRSRRV